MIVSHKHKFIFIKTGKTAGTSIEIALSRFCGEDDIITSLPPKDEKIRRDSGYPGPCNHYIPFHDYSARMFVSALFRMERKEYRRHATAEEVIKIVGKDIWDDYFKFCFERNPWDRLISLYYWVYKTEDRPSLSEFIQSDIPRRLKKTGINCYTINNEIAVNRVCLYENLQQELDDVCNNILNIKEKIELPKAKSMYRKDKRHYRDIFSNEDRKKVADMFSREIELFGYEF